MIADPELDALKREFLTEAQGKVREIQTALEDGDAAAALERVSYLAHQLKGSGGSYGFERISTEAAAIETAVETGKAGPVDAVQTRIQQHIANLHEEIDRRSRELANSP